MSTPDLEPKWKVIKVADVKLEDLSIKGDVLFSRKMICPDGLELYYNDCVLDILMSEQWPNHPTMRMERLGEDPSSDSLTFAKVLLISQKDFENVRRKKLPPRKLKHVLKNPLLYDSVFPNKKLYLRTISSSYTNKTEELEVFMEEVSDILVLARRRQGPVNLAYTERVEEFLDNWNKENKPLLIKLSEFRDILKTFEIDEHLITLVPDLSDANDRLYKMPLNVGFPAIKTIIPYRLEKMEKGQAIFRIFQMVACDVDWRVEVEGCKGNRSKEHFKQAILDVMRDCSEYRKSFVPPDWADEKIEELKKHPNYLERKKRKMFTPHILLFDADFNDTISLSYFIALSTGFHFEYRNTPTIPGEDLNDTALPVWKARLCFLLEWIDIFFTDKKYKLKDEFADIVTREMYRRVPLGEWEDEVTDWANVFLSFDDRKLEHAKALEFHNAGALHPINYHEWMPTSWKDRKYIQRCSKWAVRESFKEVIDGPQSVNKIVQLTNASSEIYVKLREGNDEAERLRKKTVRLLQAMRNNPHADVAASQCQSARPGPPSEPYETIGIQSTYSLYSLLEKYLPPNLWAQLDKSNLRCVPNDFVKIENYVKALFDISPLMRRYKTPENLTRELSSYQNFVGAHTYFGNKHGEVFYTRPKVYESFGGKKYIHREEVFTILQNLLVLRQSFHKNKWGLIIIAAFCKSKIAEFRNALDFIQITDDTFSGIEAQIDDLIQTFRQKMRPVIEKKEKIPSEDCFRWTLQTVKNQYGAKWNDEELRAINALRDAEFQNAKDKNVPAETTWKLVFFTAGIVDEVLTTVVLDNPTIFSPCRSNGTQEKPFFVRLFIDEDRAFFMKQELDRALGITTQDARFLKTVAQEKVENVTRGMKNVEFLKTPIWRTKHRAVPIRSMDGSYCQLASDYFYELLDDVVFSLQLFQKLTNVEQIEVEKFFEKLEGLFDPKEEYPYFIRSADFEKEELWIKDHFSQYADRPAETIRDVGPNGFTVEDLQNELNHLKLDIFFPMITFYAKNAHDLVSRASRGATLQTSDMYTAVGQCQFWCLFGMLPNMKDFIHNQRKCLYAVLSCKMCEEEEELRRSTSEPSSASVSQETPPKENKVEVKKEPKKTIAGPTTTTESAESSESKAPKKPEVIRSEVPSKGEQVHTSNNKKQDDAGRKLSETIQDELSTLSLVGTSSSCSNEVRETSMETAGPSASSSEHEKPKLQQSGSSKPEANTVPENKKPISKNNSTGESAVRCESSSSAKSEDKKPPPKDIKTCDPLSQKIKKLEAQVQTLKAENEKMKQKVAQADKNEKSLKKREKAMKPVKDLERDNREKQKRIEELEKEKQGQAEKDAEFENKLQAANKIIEELTAKTAELQQFNKEKDERIAEFKEKLSKEELKTFNFQLSSEMKQELGVLQSKLDFIRANDPVGHAASQVHELKINTNDAHVQGGADYVLVVFRSEFKVYEAAIERNIDIIQADPSVLRSELVEVPALPELPPVFYTELRKAYARKNAERAKECLVCLTDEDREFFFCESCPIKAHYDCLIRWWQSAGSRKCPHCKCDVE